MILRHSVKTQHKDLLLVRFKHSISYKGLFSWLLYTNPSTCYTNKQVQSMGCIAIYNKMLMLQWNSLKIGKHL
jgi:hypothetical protein